MKGKVFASGGGNAAASYLLDRDFTGTLTARMVLYIPIGLRRDIVGFEGCYEWLKTTLGQHASGIDIEMWTSVEDKRGIDLCRFDAIFIGGAHNTYRLMELLRSIHLDQRLVHFVAGGGLLYGGSSGAIVLGKNVATWGDEDNEGIEEAGLNLIYGISLFCHYSGKTESKLKAYLNNYDLPTIALPENCGLVCDHEKETLRIMGYSPALFFPGRSASCIVLKPDQEIKADKIDG